MDKRPEPHYAGRHVPVGSPLRRHLRPAGRPRRHRRSGPGDAGYRAIPHRGTRTPVPHRAGPVRHDRDQHGHVLRADRPRLARRPQRPRRRDVAGDGDSARPMRQDGRMRLRIFTEPQQGASYATLRRVATTAEALGFDGFFRSDHYLKMGDGDGQPGPTDAWATLAALAVETSRIRLGTLVTCATFRLPGPLAIAVAQVDEMSGGRVEFGIGAGWFDAEHRAYGVPFPPLKERFDRFEEQLAIITGLWETPEGKTFSFDGRYYAVTD